MAIITDVLDAPGINFGNGDGNLTNQTAKFNANKLDSVAVDMHTVAPTNGQVPVYNSGSSKFVPGTITPGTGTVTSVSVTTANGVSATVTNPTTTPALSFALAAITPTTINGVTLSGSATPTLAVTGTSTISGANTGDQTITLTGDVTGSGTGSFAATIGSNKVTYAKMQQASAGNVILANATASAANYAELSVAASRLIGRGSTGNIAAITLGTGLSISGATLNATGGGFTTTSLNYQIFTASGSYTKTANTRWAIIILTGSGGGGGGASWSSGQSAAGGGGGSGATALAWVDGGSLSTHSIGIGAGGTAGSSTGGNGGDGANSSFGVLFAAHGGKGGVGATTTTSTQSKAGGLGGTTSTNAYGTSVAGIQGGTGLSFGATTGGIVKGLGAPSYFGSATSGDVSNPAYGAGGDGAAATTVAVAGNPGIDGYCIVIELIMN